MDKYFKDFIMKKTYVNMSKSLLCIVLPAMILGGCRQSNTDPVLDAKITETENALDSIDVLCDSLQAKYKMSVAKCRALLPVVGVDEAPDVRARKNVEWLQYRDSVFEYTDRMADAELARNRMIMQLDSLVYERNRAKRR